ncbi:Zn(II)2Cys6 transcription factor CYBJADRAFT_164107 [Cyberlindnera jadinii NRRL Y-1542]|uniref:Zn(2)-C6 fungal-type domain-containing protein n=1 Tax=Cyberlindnera jadinii (strain ATCC 18201 / CBS 1600 / BCRC 20928 / JCM 3617 / NBRC 0987 / NRRL Y-1542) TaxID=983966 RepID=A0A1E4RX11_CYBJN|nr:hypothetical protein CYBJADRAFT_164107 [Cyberlindnera jadinii NRRL Y-1542]ODV71808.1 hypothetical protein CYBJADRAFT_164107 [Cyberlindnera jadinii NRRL Y-1542]
MTGQPSAMEAKESSETSDGYVNGEDSQQVQGGDSSKRKYSRNGCTECKKRRMKCDETKPSCWQCSRLGRECIYIMNRKNKKRRSKEEIEREKLNKATRSKAQRRSDEPDPQSEAQGTQFSFSFNDANLVYNDLSDLVNWRLEEALTPNLKTYIEESSNPFNTELSTHNLPLTTDDTDMIFDIPLEMFNLGEPHSEYLKRYYNEFFTLVCPFTPNVNSNPMRDVLFNYARRETYLLYAILACGAMTQHRQTQQIRDDQAYCSYLSTCLNILSDNFEDETLIQVKVEPMLLTILLLTTDCASNKNPRWRAHLKGAKELLKKTTVQSDTLNFCRNWLTSYEILAGITNPYGGIFQADGEELSRFITNDELYLNSLKRLNMIDVHGFNYLDGHIIQLDIAFRDIIRIMNKIRLLENNGLIQGKTHLNSDIVPPVLTLTEWHSISNQLDNLEEMFIIDKSGIIPPSNPNHPSHNRVKGFDAIDTVRFPSGDEITLSWFDIAHQTHIIAARVVFLNRVLLFEKNSIFIQELVKKALRYLEFLRIQPNYRNCCMTHLHMLISVIGGLCLDEKDRQLVEIFLKACYNLGLASAGHNLERIQRIWRNEVQSGEEDDVLTW